MVPEVDRKWKKGKKLNHLATICKPAKRLKYVRVLIVVVVADVVVWQYMFVEFYIRRNIFHCLVK